MSETHRLRRILRSIVAVLAGVLVIIILSIGTDEALRASGVYPPRDQRMADSLFLLATAYRVSTPSWAATSRRGSRPIGP